MVFNMLDTLILTFCHNLYEGQGHSMVWAIVENLLVNWPFQSSFKKHSKGFSLVFAWIYFSFHSLDFGFLRGPFFTLSPSKQCLQGEFSARLPTLSLILYEEEVVCQLFVAKCKLKHTHNSCYINKINYQRFIIWTIERQRLGIKDPQLWPPLKCWNVQSLKTESFSKDVGISQNSFQSARTDLNQMWNEL